MAERFYAHFLLETVEATSLFTKTMLQTYLIFFGIF